MTTQISEPVFCPACDRSFSDMTKLRAHLERAKSEGDDIHIDLIDLEGWDETSSGEPAFNADGTPKETT